MTGRVFGLTAVLGALGAGFCCLGPVVFSMLGVSSMVSLATLSWVAPYRNGLFALTLAALALAAWSVVIRRGRVSLGEWAVLGGSAAAVVGLLAYTVSIEGLPQPW
ncbi:MAG: hypothetical protein HYV46_06185 [candidate division NC10 bacterium]|nr:hypothetical protein [candidate division NC10 bacterium]